MEYVIEQAALDDAAEIIDLVNTVSDQAYHQLGSEQQHLAWQQATVSSYRQRLSQGDVLVARAAGAIVACAYLEQEKGLPHGCDVYLGGLYVSCPGRGLGPALAEALLTEAKRRGSKRALVEIVASNERWIAHARRRGFRVAGEHYGRNYDQTVWVELVYDVV